MTKEAYKEKMLELVRKDRPNQIIHEVTSIEKLNKPGWTYKVGVVMEGNFMGTKIKKVNMEIPYPLSEFNKEYEKLAAIAAMYTKNEINASNNKSTTPSA